MPGVVDGGIPVGLITASRAAMWSSSISRLLGLITLTVVASDVTGSDLLTTTDGNLSYTPAANANGASTFDVSVQDNGGAANGGVDSSATQTFTINVNVVIDPPAIDFPGGTVTT